MSRLPLIAALAFFAGPLFAADAPPAEALPPGAKVVKLDVRPAKIELVSPFGYAQLLVTATLDTGDVVDATRIAKFSSRADHAIAPNGLLRPAAGQTGLAVVTVTVGGASQSVMVDVKPAKTDTPVSFVKDVQPVLSKLGCNAGTCHGAQAGKNGFKLSLRGYDPLYDFRALTDDLEGRRFNPGRPGTQPDAAQDERGRPARRRRPHRPRGAVLRAVAEVDRRRRPPRPRNAAGDPHRGVPERPGRLPPRHEAAVRRGRHLH